MNNCEQSRVMPFRMSGVRLRASAREYRRRGQVLEALSLVRRAAMQDDTAAAWQALAAELRQLACWAAAADVLARVLSRPDAAPSAWLDMARCMSAQGQTDTAEDCLYHLLAEAPWTPEGDAAREMLQGIAQQGRQEDSHRVALLTQRAMQAWHAGAHALGLRRMQRAIRLSCRKGRLMNALAMLYLMERQLPQAMRWLARAMRAEPRNVQALCTMAMLLAQQGRRRMARGMLKKAAEMCTSPEHEASFCNMATMLCAWRELEDYLNKRLRRTPHRTLLLNARARLYLETGRGAQAQELWKRILAIDPEDSTAVAMLDWMQRNPGQGMPVWYQPVPELLRRRESLLETGDVFAWGSEARCELVWCAASGTARAQQLALEAAARHPDREAEIRWLRELLTRPALEDAFRQRVLMRLAELQHCEKVNILLGGHYVTAQCQMTPCSPLRRTWHMFLPPLLRAASRYGRASEIAAFACQLWPTLTPAERQEAAAVRTPDWCRMILSMWLWQQGRIEEADAEMRAASLPLRHFRRLVSRFLVNLEKDTGDTGEGES